MKIILTEKQEKEINKKLFLEYIESNVSGKSIICVDIQPEYQKGIYFDLQEWGEYINELSESNHIYFLYNGSDTVGGVTEQEYQLWLFEECGITEEVLLDATFYDKGYAYFRFCIDEGVDDENIVKLVQFMMKHQINDSRDIASNNMWDDFMNEYGVDANEVRELLEYADDAVSIPDLMSTLRNVNNIYIMGGGLEECLKEVIIALDALNKPYNIIDEFCY